MDQIHDTIIIGSDHAGYAMKEYVKQQLAALGVAYVDVGTDSTEPTDYPLHIARVARAVSDGTYGRGIALCGSGVGASIVANRFRRVRAALCFTEEMARGCREHNDANILVIGGRITSEQTVAAMLRAWLTTPFGGGRHLRRVELIESESQP